MSDTQHAPQRENTRLYELLVRFHQGDSSCYLSIIQRFSGLINKSSYNGYMGIMDDDLRSEIYLTLFLRLRHFVIPDAPRLEAVPSNIPAVGLPNAPK